MQLKMINAVFEGGGVKGISLAGAVRAAELNGYGFNQVAGTSAGSIVAALVAAGYNASEMKMIIDGTPFSAFLKRAPIFNVKLIGPAARLLMFKGLYSGDALEAWAEKLLAARGIRTFGDLPPGRLRIVASDITNGKILVLPDDIADYGMDPRDLGVAQAIRMSVSIPYFFDPVIVRSAYAYRPFKRAKRHGKHLVAHGSYIVDGGLLSNFPLWLFEEPEAKGPLLPVVGFQMVGRPNPKGHRISGPFTMFYAMFETMLSAHDERYIEKNNRVRTIKIPTLGVRTTDFHLSDAQSESLYQSGLDAGGEFFDLFDYRTGMCPPDLPNIHPHPHTQSGPGAPKVRFGYGKPAERPIKKD
ncbi:patatin-like phospholipase family protein [Cohnella sp. GCM10012308]|uniref:patatin-like phospholipase family protein n=1 Tax=Cohnella sp. GCM10012308 TaxID=3317329 RepID=UPI003616CF32